MRFPVKEPPAEALILCRRFSNREGEGLGRRSTRGQLFLVVVVVLLIIITFTFIAALFMPTQPSPVVEETSWRVNGLKVTSVIEGSRVEALIIVRAAVEYEGSIVVKVRKDIAFWFDKDYAISTTPVRLTNGQRMEIKLNFVPDQASGWSLRGYFIEVEFSATKTTWTMENSYPPRLRVQAPSITD